MARAARSLTKLKEQINARFPYRDKSSDGGIGDAAHASRVSDHNPDRNGVYHAYDFDHDPDSNGLNCVTLYRELKESRDNRIKYVIFNRKIWYPNGIERPYSGPNAHTSHLHLSVLSGIGDNDRAWNLPILGKTPVSIPVSNTASRVPQPYGLTQAKVMELQRVLNAWYPNQIKLVVDGDYGPRTTAAVKYAQARFKIVVDGIAGRITLGKLGIRP